jgi:nitrogen fixation protein
MSARRQRRDDALASLTDYLAQVGLEEAVVEVRCDRKAGTCVVVPDGMALRRWNFFLAEVEEWAWGEGLRVEVEEP